MFSPSKDEFRKLATQGNLIPVTCRLLADFETPLSVYLKIRGERESFLFESIEGGEHLNRYSFVGCNPKGIIKQKGDVVEVYRDGNVMESFAVVPGTGVAPVSDRDAIEPEKNVGNGRDARSAVKDGLEVVERVLSKYQPVTVPGLPGFTGGAVGFVGYEIIHDVEPSVPRPPKDELGTPTMYFLIADELVIFDRVSQAIILLANAAMDEHGSPDEAYDAAVLKLERLMRLLREPGKHISSPVPVNLAPVDFESNMPKERFLDNVERAKKYIHAGDIIQVVGSQRFSTPFDASPVDLYRAARSINPSPYMFLLELDGFSLVGASPEIHVRCEESRVEIRPIAGTRPRGRTGEEDLANEKDLLADPKERAEHVMLVDLARNDIGRVCDYGSVEVKDLMIIERYSHVMHIVSQVEGNLSGNKTPYDLIRATFPAGTLSGAPKIRAMQIISELEQTSRGPYGGTVGYFSFSGNLDCCITIRTALLKEGKAYVQAGGGWVADSVPETEFEETVNKARAMMKAVALAQEIREENR